MLINQQRTSHLPVKEPLKFSGDSFEYPAFVTAFDIIIASNVATERDKLFFLEKYTSGKANEAIKDFLATSSDTAYSEARKLLDQRFGNPVVVAEYYKRKLRSVMATIGDSKGLRELSDFFGALRRSYENYEVYVGAGFYSYSAVNFRQATVILQGQVV